MMTEERACWAMGAISGFAAAIAWAHHSWEPLPWTAFGLYGLVDVKRLNAKLRGRRYRGFPIVVCKSCVHPSDEEVGVAGDFGLCSRCQESVTSKTGVTVRERRL